MDDRQIRVLLIEDDEEDYLTVKGYLALLNMPKYAVEWVSSYNAGVEALKRCDYDVCLLDYRLGVHDGLDLLGEAARINCRVPIIFLTSYDDRSLDMAAMYAGACDYLQKDRIDSQSLERSIRYAISNRKSAEALEKAYADLERKVEERTRELQESEAREHARRAELEALLEAIPSPVWISHDPECKTIIGNPAAHQIFGISQDEANLASSGWSKALQPFEVRRNGFRIGPEQMSMQLAAASGKPILRDELEIVRQDGTVRWVYGNSVPLLDAYGRVRGCMSVAVDFTERKQTERLLRESEESLRLALRAAKAGVWKWNIQTDQLVWSPENYELYGIPPGPLSFADWECCIHPDDRARVKLITRNTIDARMPEFRAEFRLVQPKQGVRWLLSCGRVEYSADGVPLCLFGINLDITGQKEVEEALRRSEERLSLALRVAHAGAWMHDLRTGDIFWSLENCLLFGVDPAMGPPEKELWQSLVHPDDLLAVEQAFRNALDQGSSEFSCEFRLIHPERGLRWILGIGHVVRGEDGIPIQRTGINIDITDRKLMEEELRCSRDELEMRVRERTAALAEANEELRKIPSKLIAVQEDERKRLASELHDSIGQTLAAVKFWVEMVLKCRDEGDVTAALDHLEQFVPTLQQSIEETRNIYMGLRPSMLDSMGLLSTLDWLRREAMRLYPHRHIEVDFGIAEEDVPETLKVSIFRIAQECLNNIAKHSESEWVDISLRKNGGGLELSVSDDGVGMDLGQIIGSSTARSLGLTSMRERAELTGGRLSIDSVPGGGTRIRVRWPGRGEGGPARHCAA